MERSESRPRAQGLGCLEAGDVADLGDEDGGEDAAHALDGLDGVVAGVVAKDAVDVAVQEADLAVVELDEVSQHGDAVESRRRGARGSRAGRHRPGPTCRLGSGGSRSWPSPVDLGLETGAQVGQLHAEADHLAELPGLGWGDPGLGQAAETKQVGQVSGVALVVLTRRCPLPLPCGLAPGGPDSPFP